LELSKVYLAVVAAVKLIVRLAPPVMATVVGTFRLKLITLGIPSWVTVIVLVKSPLTSVTVMVPIRVKPLAGNAETRRVIVPLPVPLLGETLSQVVSLLVAVQLMLEVT